MTRYLRSATAHKQKHWDAICWLVNESQELLEELMTHPEFNPLDPVFLELRETIRKRREQMRQVGFELRRRGWIV